MDDDDEFNRLVEELTSGVPVDAASVSMAPDDGGRPPRARNANITTANIVAGRRRRDRGNSDSSEGELSWRSGCLQVLATNRTIPPFFLQAP